jgi:hypothetical protein
MTRVFIATIIYKTTFLRLLSFLIILVFASGIIILFIYASSLSPLQVNKIEKSAPLLFILLLRVAASQPSQLIKTDRIKIFTRKLIVPILAILLIFTILSISLQGWNPLQTLSSTF